MTVLLVTAMLITAAFTACSAPGAAGSVSVLGAWTGPEQNHFEEVLRSFTRDTGVTVRYQGTRALNEVLFSNVQNGTPPDIAILFSPGELARYQRRGNLHPLDDVIDSPRDAYSTQWLKLQKLGTTPPHLYGVVVKANLKSIIWYNPKRIPELTTMPESKIATWDQLVARSEAIAKSGGRPWCLGMGATPTSGWPGTDWIEDILLHQFGIDAYRRWSSGNLSWQSPEVVNAWQDWGRITATENPRLELRTDWPALLTDWGDAARPMFADPPGCYFNHQPSFAMTNYQTYDEPKPSAGVDFDFFEFPDSRSPTDKKFEVSADMAGMFNDTPQARKLISYLATDKAQEIWPHAGGAAFSANRKVQPSAYPDDLSRRIARELTTGNTLCYDGADLMPATMRNAFYGAVLEYMSDPSQLDRILGELEEVRQGIAREEWLDIPCER